MQTVQWPSLLLATTVLLSSSSSNLVDGFSSCSPSKRRRPTLNHHHPAIPLYSISNDKERSSEISSFKNDTVAVLERSADDSTETEATAVPLSPLLSSEDEEEPSSSLSQLYRRQRAAQISHSFETRPYRPAWWAQSSHIQTIFGVLSRSKAMYTDQENVLLKGVSRLDDFEWDHRQRVTTPDNDFFDVDWKYSTLSSSSSHADDAGDSVKPIVLICHGLQSSSSSPLAKDMANAFNSNGMDAAVVNFRGCSGELNALSFGYHLSFTDDLDFYIRTQIQPKYPKRPIYFSGFSLGANVVTKYLQQLGDEAYELNIQGAAVNAVPFNLMKVWQNLSRPGVAKTLYGDRLCQSLVDSSRQGLENGIELPFTAEDLDKCETIIDMENLVVCSLFDFDDAFDYYRKSSTIRDLDKISVPQLVINALDDPFFVGNENPDEHEPSLPFRVQFTERGGHCGYILHERLDGEKEEDALPLSGWLPTQLSRFLSHVEEQRRICDNQE